MSKPPVILLHGLLRTRYSMSYLASRLRKEGFATFNYGYRSRARTISEQAHLLHEYLQRDLKSELSLSFVTHSLGSIIVRRFALEYGSRYRLHRIVMLGPPNQGSRFAARIKKLPVIPGLLGPAFHELTALELSSAIGDLEVGIIAGGRGNSRGFSPLIEGDNDGIVAVEETFLSTARAHRVMPGLHSFLMYYPGVIREVIGFLKNGKFGKD